MTAQRAGRPAGSALLEFTLVGIPLIFMLISVFEISRGMWMYQTLAYTVRQATRYAAVHGQGCTIPPNACTVTVAQIAGRIRMNGVGLREDQLNVVLTASNGAVSCRLDTCLTMDNQWPTAPGNLPGRDLEIRITHPFRSAIAMVWPGATSQRFGVTQLPAVSRERVQF